MPLRPLKVNASYAIGFSPCGSTCLTLGRDVVLWDIESRTKRWRVRPIPHPADATFSPKGDQIAVKNTSGRTVILRSDSGDVLRSFENDGESEGSNLVFSDDGRFLVDGSWDEILTVRNSSTGDIHYRREFPGEMICRVHSVRNGTVWILEHSPKSTADEQRPAEDYFTISTWPLSDGAFSPLGIRLSFIRASTVSQDGSRLAVVFGAPPRDVHVYELPSAKLLWRDRVDIGGSGAELRFSRCGSFLASVQKDSIIHYLAATGARLEVYPIDLPSDADYSPNLRCIALGSWHSGEIRSLAAGEMGNGEPVADANAGRGSGS